MGDDEKLIPPPPVVRERLARNIQERRILRSLLKLSIKDAEIRQDGKRREAAPCA